MKYFLLSLWILLTMAVFIPKRSKLFLALALLFSYFYLTWSVFYAFIA